MRIDRTRIGRWMLRACLVMLLPATEASAQTSGCCLPHGACVVADELTCLFSHGGEPVRDCANPAICLGACCRATSCSLTGFGTCNGVFRRLNTTCQACVGACCLDDGSCADLEPGPCGVQGGVHRGADFACASTVCGGACCAPNGACRSSSPEACIPDEFLGPGTACGDTDCLSACCHEDGTCFDAGTVASCDAAGAEFRGRGTRCAATECLGACCLPEKRCLETTPSACEKLPGAYQGDGSSCLEECPSRLSTGFTYQGQLRRSGLPYSGVADFQFSLWDLPSDGQLVAAPVAVHSLDVVNGLLTTVLDFGAGALNGNARWLEAAVCTEACGGPDTFTTLEPRQPLTAAPYALQTRGMVVDELGHVGIGTKNPANAGLHVKKEPMSPGGTLAMEGITQTYMTFFPEGIAAGRKGFLGFASSSANSITLANEIPEGDIILTPGPRGQQFAGGVGIGTTNPNAMLHVEMDNGWAGYFQASGLLGRAVTGIALGDARYGVWGETSFMTNAATPAIGVFGRSNALMGTGIGVYGRSDSPEGWSIFSDGRFGASGPKAFCIDHPRDPANKYLLHYSAEGPEPQNIYNGVVTLDGAGAAEITLPDYFADINRDPRYSLTAIGAPMPNLHVAREIAGTSPLSERTTFRIGGGKPAGKVSWEVKAVRNDRWMKRYGAPIETEKPDGRRGTYVRPELYGAPTERGFVGSAVAGQVNRQ